MPPCTIKANKLLLTHRPCHLVLVLGPKAVLGRLNPRALRLLIITNSSVGGGRERWIWHVQEGWARRSEVLCLVGLGLGILAGQPRRRRGTIGEVAVRAG